MYKISNPESYEVCAFDGVNAGTVYKGGFSSLQCINSLLHWRTDDVRGELCFSPFKVLTLSEIRDQMKNIYGGKCPVLTVFIESPLSGYILQYGNYGDEWWHIGEISGYA